MPREKARTREGDAIEAARRRLPMVELDGTVEVTSIRGPALELLHGPNELVIYQHLWFQAAAAARRTSAPRSPGR